METFEDKLVLNKMLRSRSFGWSFFALAYKYECDVEVIKTLCTQYQVKVKPMNHGRGRAKVFEKEPDTPKPLVAEKKFKYEALLDERLNLGKSYKDYLRDGK